MPTTLPGLPNREAGWIVQQMDKKLKAFPEVERVFGKIGRADTSTDPAPLTMIETTMLLQPKSKWRPGMTKDKLVAEMDKAVETIGYVNAWVQPIRARVMMQSTGIQTPVGIKVKGPDVARHRGASRSRSRRLLRGVAGHEVGASPSAFPKATTSTCGTTSSAWPSTASPSTRRCRPCATPSAATTSSASSRPTTRSSR